MDKPLLEVKNLQTFFNAKSGTVKAVDDVSFSIGQKQVLGIVGESGSGKSVSCLSIIRLIDTPPGEIKSGQIIFHEEKEKTDLLSLPEKSIRTFRGKKIAMIFQDPMSSLNPAYKCGRQVDEMLKIHEKLNKESRKNRILDLFSKVGLIESERIYNSYPHQLSGGQIQRVMIAMALSCEPDLIIADEPTTALDVTIQKKIIDLFNTLKKELNTSFIFISHDLGVIKQIADEVVIMYRGKVVEKGSVHQIFNTPKHAYTKSLLACKPPLEFKAKRLPTVSDLMDKNPDEVFKIEKYSAKELENILRTQSKNEPILEVRNLKKYYPKTKSFFGKPLSYTKAVDDVSFTLKEGECLGLVGESGCGKSTLGRTILRLIEANSGEIIYKGKSILNYSQSELRKLRKSIQIIFQDPYASLNPRMKIGKAILEPMQVHKLHGSNENRVKKVYELLEKVGLEANNFDRYPHEFSGGQRQRICIARALALEPEFIICDECVSALDVSVQAQVLNLLLDLKAEFGLSYIFISHDLSVVKFISDRMLIMKNGKIVERGPSQSVYDKPKEAYTQSLIEAIPNI